MRIAARFPAFLVVWDLQIWITLCHRCWFNPKCCIRVTQGWTNWKIMLTWHLGLNQPLWHSEWDCWWRMFNSPCMENGLQILPNDLKLYGIWFTILLIDIKILGDRDFYSLLIWFLRVFEPFSSQSQSIPSREESPSSIKIGIANWRNRRKNSHN